jgi:hypothetical protein
MDGTQRIEFAISCSLSVKFVAQFVTVNLRDGSHKSTDIADVDSEGIGNLEQSLLEESCGTM